MQSAPPLPEPSPEEEFPDDPKTHRLFNQNVLWNFEDLRMLLGTDLPIFGGGTYPCLSLRLRFGIFSLLYVLFSVRIEGCTNFMFLTLETCQNP